MKHRKLAQSRMDFDGGVMGMIDPGNMGPGSTYMGSAMATMVSVLQITKVAYEFENSLFGAASCTFCKAGLMFLQYYLDRDIGLERVQREANILCKGVGAVSLRVCKGLVSMFSGDIMHVVKNSNQSPEEMCGFMFGEACGNPQNPRHEWKALVPP